MKNRKPDYMSESENSGRETTRPRHPAPTRPFSVTGIHPEWKKNNPLCPKCGGPTISYGSSQYINKEGQFIRYIRCVECSSGYRTSLDREILPPKEVNAPRCPKCGGSSRSDGTDMRANGYIVRRRRCKQCFFRFRPNPP